MPDDAVSDTIRSPLLILSSFAHPVHDLISPGGISNLPTPEVAIKDEASEAAARRLQHRMNRLSAELCCQVRQPSEVNDDAPPEPASDVAAASFKRWSDPKELVKRRVRARLTASKCQETSPPDLQLLIAEASPATCRDGTLLPLSPRCTLTPLGRLPTPAGRSELSLDEIDTFEAVPRHCGGVDEVRTCLAAR